MSYVFPVHRHLSRLTCIFKRVFLKFSDTISDTIIVSDLKKRSKIVLCGVCQKRKCAFAIE